MLVTLMMFVDNYGPIASCELLCITVQSERDDTDLSRVPLILSRQIYRHSYMAAKMNHMSRARV